MRRTKLAIIAQDYVCVRMQDYVCVRMHDYVCMRMHDHVCMRMHDYVCMQMHDYACMQMQRTGDAMLSFIAERCVGDAPSIAQAIEEKLRLAAVCNRHMCHDTLYL
jgi:hypothetical protein